MSEDNPCTHSGTFLARALACGRDLWRQVSNPLALGLLALSLAVTFSAYGYKLSLYCVPAGKAAPHLPVAKLWIEHRFGFATLSSSAISPKPRARVCARPGAFALLVSVPGLNLRAFLEAMPAVARPRSTPFFHAAIPLRSPPPVISL